ncbi:substrate-binding periplasmic protein [Marinicellulosiphila megalodicopiae]|uniref:substrate-binding periplasmic protein n=1 Tax=Marinicellulosiphila megalodicopiae TaxID=2724896 RepID=UPI003BAE1A2D
MNQTIFNLKFILPIILVNFCSVTYAQNFTVASYQWAPYIDNNKANEGVSIALINEIFTRQGHSISIKYLPWARALEDLDKAKVDILPAVWLKEERLKVMSYSDPYLYNRLIFIKSKQDPFEYHSSEDLNNKMIGVIREYAYDGKILDHSKAIFFVADSLISNLKKVASHRIDFTIEDEYTYKANVPKDLENQLSITNNALDETPLHITCSNTNPQCKTIISIFNSGLLKLKESGDLSKILNNFGE